jgi:hypothetical protein
MSASVPDLSKYWLAERAFDGRMDVAPRADEELAAAVLLQQFEALVERVNAARSVY